MLQHRGGGKCDARESDLCSSIYHQVPLVSISKGAARVTTTVAMATLIVRRDRNLINLASSIDRTAQRPRSLEGIALGVVVGHLHSFPLPPSVAFSRPLVPSPTLSHHVQLSPTLSHPLPSSPTLKFACYSTCMCKCETMIK